MSGSGSLQVELEPDGRTLRVEGELDGEAASRLGPALARAEAALPPGDLRLDLDGLELRDGVAVAVATSALRALLERRPRLTLANAPQMLAHTLYRVGALERGLVVVESVRAEEPTTAN